MTDLTDFSRYLQKLEFAEGTIYGYVHNVENYFRTYNDITTENLIEYKKTLLTKLAPGTVNRHICALRSYMKYKGIEAQIHELKLPKRINVENVIDMAYYKLLISKLKAEKDIHGYINILVLAYTGCRISEGKRITKSDLARGYVEMPTKGKIRRILLPKKLEQDIFEYIKEMPDNEPIMRGTKGGILNIRAFQVWLKNKAKKYNIPPEYMHPHAFRHFFAINFLKETGNVMLLADLLGHSNINTTMIYTRMSLKQQQDTLNNSINW